MEKENMDIFWDGIETIIKNILDKEDWDRKEDGEYFSTLFADYRDEIENCTLKDIMSAEFPREALDEYFYDMETEKSWEHEYPELMDKIEGALPAELFEHFKDDILLWLEEHVHYEADKAHYNRSVCLTLFVDSGDADYDYTCNNILNYAANGDGEFPEESSILWLAKQQGKEELLRKAVKDCLSPGPVKMEDRFVSSAVSELENLTSSMGALIFLIKMPLLDYMKLIDDIQHGENGTVTIPKNTECGLFDKWNGGGSVLEIELDKDVELPYFMIADLIPDIDKCYGFREQLPWSVHNVYAVSDGLWKTDLTFHTEEKEQEEEIGR